MAPAKLTVQCLHQKILEGTLEFVRAFILMKEASAVVFKQPRRQTATHVATAHASFEAAQQVCVVVVVRSLLDGVKCDAWSRLHVSASLILELRRCECDEPSHLKRCNKKTNVTPC